MGVERSTKQSGAGDGLTARVMYTVTKEATEA